MSASYGEINLIIDGVPIAARLVETWRHEMEDPRTFPVLSYLLVGDINMALKGLSHASLEVLIGKIGKIVHVEFDGGSADVRLVKVET